MAQGFLPRLLPALAVVVLLAIPLAAEGQTIEIRPVYVEGLELRYEFANESRSVLPQGMGEMLQEFVVVSRTWVTSLNADGSGVQASEIESARVRTLSPMGNETWDSTVDAEPRNPAFAPMARMVGRRTETPFGPEARPTDLGALVDELMGDSLSAPERGLVQETMSGLQAGIDGMPDLLTGPFSVGESRDMDMSLAVPFMGGMKMTRRYTLERVEDRDGGQVAFFAITGTMALGDEEDAPGVLTGMGMSFSAGEVTGHMVFDVDRGILIESTESTSMSIEFMGEEMLTVTEVRMRLIP